MIERILFNVVAFALFIYLFFKMIQKNDTNYLYILGMQALGIAIGFVGLVFRIQLHIILTIITYILSIVIPIIVIIVESKGITLTEVIYLALSHMYLRAGNEDEARKMLLKLIEKNPRSYYAHKELAQIYEKNNELEVAIEEYIRAVNVNPKDSGTNFKIAELFNKTGKPNESIKILNELLKEKPDFESASLLLRRYFVSARKI